MIMKKPVNSTQQSPKSRTLNRGDLTIHMPVKKVAKLHNQIVQDNLSPIIPESNNFLSIRKQSRMTKHHKSITNPINSPFNQLEKINLYPVPDSNKR